jgi:hypothetical protein
MKKLLLAVSVLFFASAVSAQTNVVNARAKGTPVPYHKVQLKGTEEVAVPQSIAPMMRTTSRNFIGTTYYDCQSNGSMASRVVAHNDGTVSAIWTSDNEQFNHRGTGYNYYNGSSWINPASSTDRIENVRTGWPSIACVGDAEIVVAHNGSNALVVATRPHKGTGDWTFTTKQGPQASNGTSTSTALLWPSIVASGNTLHMIACTESDDGYLFQGINTCLVYYRGTYNESDNTITWEEPRVVGNVDANEYPRFSGDNYAIAAKGNNVAIVAMPSTTMDAFLWKSTDGGVNFTKTVFLESAIKNGDLSAMMDTNLYVNDGCCAVAIGDDGVAHVAFGAYLVVSDVDTGDSWYWYPGIGYLCYWNDTQAPILYNNDDTYMQPDVLTAAGHGVIERFSIDCGEEMFSPTSWGVDAYPSYGVGAVSFPQMVAENGNVYMVFCQVLEYPFSDLVNSMYYRGVFACKSTNNGQSFGDYSWLSYNKDCTYMDSWDWAPLTEDNIETNIEEMRNAVNTEGESVYPAVANKIVNGKLVMTWQQDYFAGTYIKDEMAVSETYDYFFSLDAAEVGVYNNTNEVCQGLWIDPAGVSNEVISGMKIYPNPASDAVNITFSSEESADAVVSVMNLMGQTVYTSNVNIHEGYNMVNVPVNQFSAGVYVVNIKSNKGTSTQKMIVK